MVEYQRNPPLFGDREEMDNFYCTLSVTPNVVQITFYVVVCFAMCLCTMHLHGTQKQLTKHIIR